MNNVLLLISGPLILAATCGLSYLGRYDTKITDKQKLIKDIEKREEEVLKNFQESQRQYDKATSSRDHLTVIQGLGASQQLLDRRYSELVIELKHAIICAFSAANRSPTEEDGREWADLNTYEDLWPILERCLLLAVNRLNGLSSQRKGLEKSVFEMERFRRKIYTVIIVMNTFGLTLASIHDFISNGL